MSTVPGARVHGDWAVEIVRFRRLHALKQAAMAELLGVDQATISRWETGRSIPDRSVQRRLQTLVHRTPSDEALVKHWTRTALGQVLLSTPQQIAVVASRGYCAVHGVTQDQIVGMSMRPTWSEAGAQLWLTNRDHGFYRGDVASTVVVAAANSLTNQFRNRYIKALFIPVRLADGRIFLRSERQELTECEFVRGQQENGGPIQIRMMDDLVC